MKFVQIFIFALFFNFSSTNALENCKEHAKEIEGIRTAAAKSFFEAHRMGGYLFRSSIAFTDEEASKNQVRSFYTYNEFAKVFRDHISRCKPKGVNRLYEGYSEMGDLFFNMYTNCIAKHKNIIAYYQRGRILYDRGLYEESLNDISAVFESGYSEDLVKSIKSEELLSVIWEGLS